VPVVPPTNAYAAVSDLTLYGAPAGAFVATTPEQQQAAVTAANAKADSYLGRRFALPLSTWGADLVRAVAVMATWDAIVVRGSNPEAPGSIELQQRAQAAEDWLKAIAEGTIPPPDSITGSPTATGSGSTGGEGEFVAAVSSDDSGRFVVSYPRSGRGW
jgi:phage gp36-like protein